MDERRQRTAPAATADSDLERLDTPIMEVTGDAVVRPEPARGRKDSLVGTVLGARYRVIDRIGEGGMGAVYLTEHVLIEKRFAVKVLAAKLKSKPGLVRRFLDGARAASRIGHENIVDIVDFGETPSGSPFIAMEYLEGRDLAKLLETQAGLGFPRARHIIMQVCQALAASHGAGVVHRDLKPENIFLVDRADRVDFVKILDFGVAKITDVREGARHLTQAGIVFGTPEYMAPEQACGDRVDHRADIYAAGCILYELLTGTIPFNAASPTGLLSQHMFDPPEPPSVRAPDLGISSEVDQVVLRAMAKDRDERFSTMKEMAMALAAVGDSPEVDGTREDDPSGVIEVERTATYQANRETVRFDTASVLLNRPGRSRGRWLLGGMAIVAAVVAGVGLARVELQATASNSKDAAPVIETTTRTTRTTAPAPPGLSRVTVRTTPDGANVIVNGRREGTTPRTPTQLRGAASFELLLTKPGYLPWRVTVDPKADRVYEVELARAPPAGQPAAAPATRRPRRPRPAFRGQRATGSSKSPAANPRPPAATRPNRAPAPARPGPVGSDLHDPF